MRRKISLLINIWADESILQVLDNCSRKKPIFEKISKRLEEGGFTRSYFQTREKNQTTKTKIQKDQR